MALDTSGTKGFSWITADNFRLEAGSQELLGLLPCARWPMPMSSSWWTGSKWLAMRGQTLLLSCKTTC